MGVRKMRVKKDPLETKTILNSVDDLVEVAETEGFYNGKVLDVYRLAENIGLSVYVADLDDDISGRLFCDEKGDWIAEINSVHHENRKRFTLAHEIAHFCSHIKDKQVFEDSTFFRSNETDGMEIAANKFAAELLIPQTYFDEAISAGINTLDKLSEHFGVSSLAVQYRAKSLGYSMKENG